MPLIDRNAAHLAALTGRSFLLVEHPLALVPFDS
jgi:hypothetical protein